MHMRCPVTSLVSCCKSFFFNNCLTGFFVHLYLLRRNLRAKNNFTYADIRFYCKEEFSFCGSSNQTINNL